MSKVKSLIKERRTAAVRGGTRMSNLTKGRSLVADSMPSIELTSAAQLRLSDPTVSAELRRELDAMRAKPALAEKFLVDLGVLTPKTGKLTKRFGG